jgi:hypothetical protein
MVGKILQPEIRSLIDARDFGALRDIFRDWPPADVAEVPPSLEYASAVRDRRYRC